PRTGSAIAILANGRMLVLSVAVPAFQVSTNIPAAQNALALEETAQEFHQMRAQGETQHLVIGKHVLAFRHDRQGRDLFLWLFLDELMGEEWQRIVIGEAAHIP